MVSLQSPPLLKFNSNIPKDVAEQPDIYVTEWLNPSLTYMLVMLDLNIPDSDVTTASEYNTLVPGLETNTTTRLHWWQGNYTIQDGIFVNSSDSLSEYTAPRPRDTTNHTYAFYLFEQPDTFVVPEAAANGDYYSGLGGDRFNYSLADTISQAGGPVAANYFLSDLIA